jgi:Carboxypeptidase regulatory-like domain
VTTLFPFRIERRARAKQVQIDRTQFERILLRVKCIKGSTSYCLLLSLAFLLVITPLPAQDATGKIEGTLRDPQGAGVPNALMTTIHLRSGPAKSVVSDRVGNFVLVLLPIGEYRLTVEANNFAK